MNSKWTISQAAKSFKVTPQAVRKRLKTLGIVPQRDAVSGWQTITTHQMSRLIQANGKRKEQR